VLPDSQSVLRALSRFPEDVPGVLSVLEALQVIAELRAPRLQEDGLACFNYLYREITREVRKRIDNDEFEDKDFITRLDVEFAKRYFEAVLADAAGTQVPDSWGVLLDRRSAPNIADGGTRMQACWPVMTPTATVPPRRSWATGGAPWATMATSRMAS
jgi:hypothetical protein